MSSVLSYPSPKELLVRFGLKPKHSFGQNFLSDVHLAERIARLAVGLKVDAPVPEEKAKLQVLEIGGGLGALSYHLLRFSEKLSIIERDRELIPALSELFAEEREQARLKLLEADAKAVDFAEELSGDEPAVITGNLPYQITGPLLEKTVLFPRAIERAVFLVQKEVADRLAARPGGDDYGALTVFVQARFEVTRAFVIKGGAFYPPPRVDSAVVLLKPWPTKKSEETPQFRKLVHAAFHQRRKTLRNAWRGLAELSWLEAAAQAVGIQLEQRGETLSVEQFAAMGERLAQYEAASKPAEAAGGIAEELGAQDAQEMAEAELASGAQSLEDE